jgi:hypothetical protein
MQSAASHSAWLLKSAHTTGAPVLVLAEVSPPPLIMPVVPLLLLLLVDSSPVSEPLMLALMPPDISVVPLMLALMLPASSPSVALAEPDASVGVVVPVGPAVPVLLALSLALTPSESDAVVPLSPPQPRRPSPGAARAAQNPTTARLSRMWAA